MLISILMKFGMKNDEGQALIEFLLTGSLLLPCVIWAGVLLWGYWQEGKCAYFAFETAHQASLGRVSALVEETPEAFVVHAKCFRGEQRVSLPKLSSAVW